MYFDLIDSPVGGLLAASDGLALTGLYFYDERTCPEPQAGWRRVPNDSVLDACRRQLAEYFKRARRRFDLPLAARGTAFQHKVWQALGNIAYGETRSYAQIAAAIGAPKSMRAVGAANGANPISIVVPCHRVIGADGSLTGYGGGLERKRALLALEAPSAPRAPLTQGR
jgi:methylated-DNA-[protein]-cysteine S-methyltransferase